MGLDLGTISASVGLNTSPLAAGAVKAKAMFSGLDKSLSTGLKASQGGIKGLASSLGSLGGLGVGIAAAAGVTALVAGLASCVKEAMEAQKVIAETNAILKTTGGVSNVTADGLAKLSYAIAKKTGYDDEAVQSAGNMLLTFPKVRNEVGKTNDIFNQALDLSTDMARKFGTDVPQAAKLLGKALGEPVKGVTALQRMGVMLTESQKEQVKAFVESGNILAAQKVILGEVRSEVGLVAEAYGSTLAGKIDIAKMEFGNLKETIGNALLPVLSNALDTMAKWDWSKIGTGISSAVTTAVTTIQSIWKVLDTLKIPAALSAFAHTLAELASAWNEAFGPSKVDGTFDQRVAYKAAGYAEIDKQASAHLPNISKLNKKMLQDASNTLIGEVPIFKANAMGLMDAVNNAIRTTDLKGATREKIASMAQGISDATGLPVANIQALLDQLAGKITATDLRTPTGQTMKQMVKGIADITGLSVGEIDTLLTKIKGRVSAEDLAGASQKMINTMAKGISDATGYDEESIRRVLTVLSQTAGSWPIIANLELSDAEMKKTIASISKQVDIPVVFNPETGQFETAKKTAQVPLGTPVTLNPITNQWEVAKTGAEQPVTTPVPFNPITGLLETAKRTAQGRIDTWVYFQPNTSAADAARARLMTPIGTMFTITTQTKVNPIFSHPYQAGEYIGKQITAGAAAANPMATVGTGGGSAMSDLASATDLVNASFGNFIKDMTAEPLDEVNNAIMRLTANNTSSLGDWWKLRGAYDAATASLASYEKQIKTGEAAITSLEGKIEKANAARERPSMVMDKASSELQLKIMKAEDVHNYALAAKLTLEKDALDRKKEELDLTTSIADKTKELKDTSAFKGKTTAQIDAMIATWSAALLKKTNQVAALKVTYDKVQTSVDKFKKIIDDLAAYFTSKSPAPTGYASGTSYVPRTGMALVHQGEQIIPANLNPLATGRGQMIQVTSYTTLDGKVLTKTVSRYQGGQANSRAMSGGKY